MTATLGTTQRAVLAELAAADGITVGEIAERCGLNLPNAHRAAGTLARRRLTVVLRYRRDATHRIAIWGVTGAGRRALGLPVPLPQPAPAETAEPGREGECRECGYLKTAPGHLAACGEMP